MKNPHARRHKAAREAEHAARDMARANGATDEQWAEAERLAVLAWPGQLEDFGSSPRAIAFMRAAWCAWLIDDRQAGTDAALRITQAMSGHPVDGHQIASVPKVDVDACIRSLGVDPFDVQAEAQNTLRTSAPWALIVALGGVADVASERCTANVRTSVAALLCGDDDTAQHVLTARIADFARRLQPALDVPGLTVGPLFGGVTAAPKRQARLPTAARYVQASLDADMWPWDAALCEALRGLGRTGSEAADDIAMRARQRMLDARAAIARNVPTLRAKAVGFDSSPWDNRGDLLSQWVTGDVSKHPLGMPWLKAVAWALWEDVVRPELEKRDESAPRLTIPKYYGSDFSIVSTMGNVIGGFVGEDDVYLEALGAGSDFVEIPQGLEQCQIMASRGAVLAYKLRERLDKQQQGAFCMASPGEEGSSGVIDAMASHELPLMAGKLAIAALADRQSRQARVVTQHPDKWVDLLRGHGFNGEGAIIKRAIRRADDSDDLAAALNSLMHFIVVLPGRSYAQAFQVQTWNPDTGATEETRVGIGCSDPFVQASSIVSGRGPGVPHGMLVHMPSLFAHQGKQGSLHFRAQLALAEMWNKAHDSNGAFDESKLPWLTPEMLAAKFNALSFTAAGHILDGSGDRKRKSRDLKTVFGSRGVLPFFEAAGIIGGIQQKKSGVVRAMPPKALIAIRAKGAEARATKALPKGL